MNKLTTILLSVTLVLSGVAFYKSMGQKKIAYIQSSELIYSYQGMKEAQELFKEKEANFKANIETLKEELEQAYRKYNEDASKLKPAELKERQELIKRQEHDYIEYTKKIKKQEKEEENRMTEGVLNQVNSFIEQYSKEYGYDLVLGTTSSGNLLYANEAMDITKEVLKALNENYKSR